MDHLHQLLFWNHDRFLGLQWGWWEVIGWLGNAIFSTRFLVQWYASEKRRQVVVPTSFWWLSLAGSLLLLAYAIFAVHNVVMIFAYAFNWIPYLRSLILHRRHAEAHQTCAACGELCPPHSNFCHACGVRLGTAALPKG